MYKHLHFYIYSKKTLCPIGCICGKILNMTGIGCRVVWGLKEANCFIDHRHLPVDTLHDFFDFFSNLHG